VIVLLLLTHFNAFSQDDVLVIWYEEQTRYCITEQQALLTVELDMQNEIHKGQIIDLKGKNAELQKKVDAKDKIIEATDSIIEVKDEQHELTKKELRQRKNKAIREWFKNNAEKLLIGSGAFVGGVAVGIGTGFSVR